MAELKNGLQDKFYKIRITAIQKIGNSGYKKDADVLEAIENIAKKDADRKVKAAAIEFLVKNGDKKYSSIYETAINDSSYNVAGAAFKGLVAANPEGAYELAKKYSKDVNGLLGEEVMKIILTKGNESDYDFVAESYSNTGAQEKFGMTDKFADYLSKVNDINKIKQGIDLLIDFRNTIPEQYKSYTESTFKKAFDKISKAKGKEVEDYVKEVFKD
jgi:aminopeptidase N